MTIKGEQTLSLKGTIRRLRHFAAWGLALCLIALAASIPASASAPPKPVNRPSKQAIAAQATSPAGPAAKARAVASFGNQPLRFEANQGQAAPEIKFLVRTAHQTVFLTSTEIILMPNQAPEGKTPAPVRISLARRGAKPKITGVGRLPGVTNYFQSRDSKQWRTGIPSFAKVIYKGVYPGIDLVFYASPKSGGVEYDYLVRPGANPASVTHSIAGASRLALDKGDLMITAPGGQLRQPAPLMYQNIHGARRKVSGGYVLKGTTVKFRVRTFDPSRILVIDPMVAWSTYVSSSGGGSGRVNPGSGPNSSGTGANGSPHVAVDAGGNAYLSGITFGGTIAFPTTQPTFHPLTAGGFVAKFSPTGAMVYSTYFGENQSTGTVPSNVAADKAGNAYVVGTTATPLEFPTTSNAFRPTGTSAGDYNGDVSGYGGTGARFNFLSRLDPTGRVAYSTYLWPTVEGGSSSNPHKGTPMGVAVGVQDSVFVTGIDYTGTLSYQTWTAPYRACGSGAGPANGGPPDAFVAKFDTSESAVGAASMKFVKCGVGGRDITLRNGAVYALDDGFAKKSIDGDYTPKGLSRLDREVGTTLSLNPNVTGLALSTAPEMSADNSVYSLDNLGPGQGVKRFDKDDTAFTSPFSYRPSNGGITLDIAIASDGELYATGYGDSTAIVPTMDAFQHSYAGGVSDAFVVRLNPSGSATYATWLGGSYCPPGTPCDSSADWTTGLDRGTAIALDLVKNFYVIGLTNSYDFPTEKPQAPEAYFQPNRAASQWEYPDMFAARFTDALPKMLSIVPSQGLVCERTKVTITGTGFPDKINVSFGAKDAGSLPVTHTPATGSQPATDTVTALSPKPDVPGPVDVKVSTPGQNSSSTTLANGFTYLPSVPPVLESVEPRGGSPLGGEAVTVRGNLACVNQVTFGDTPAKDFRLSDDRTSLVATSPAHDPGPVRIAINTEDKIPGLPKGVDADLFTFAPLITALDPPSGDTLGGTKVKITGKGFLRATRALAFGDTPGIFTVNSDTEIIATSPPHTAGDVLVGIVTAENLRAVAQNTGADVFHYAASKVGALAGDGGTTGGRGDAQKGIVQPGTPGGASTSAAPASQPAQAANAQPLGNAQPSAGGTQAQAPVFGSSGVLSPGFAAAAGTVASQSAGSALGGAAITTPVAGTAPHSDKQPDPATRFAMTGRSSKGSSPIWTLQIASFALTACFVSFGRRPRFLSEGPESENASPAPQIA